MRKRDPILERMKRLSGPSSRELREAWERDPREAEDLLNAHIRINDLEGDEDDRCRARYDRVRFYVSLMMGREAPNNVEEMLRRAVADMESINASNPQLQIYAAGTLYRVLKDSELSLRLARRGLELAKAEEDHPRFPGMPQWPFRAMALRVELSILACEEPACRRVVEILDELSGLDNVATHHDYDREDTVERLLASGIRTEAFRLLLTKDRQAFPHRRGSKPIPPAVQQIDSWLERWG